MVREVDALGGVMGRAADRATIQFRMLNRSKGPAVWSPRCQSDRKLYSEEACKVISITSNIEIIEESVVEILAEDEKVVGVRTASGKLIKSCSVILSSGTFLNGKMHTGLISTTGGRYGQIPSLGITDSLIRLGFTSARLKTGTPPRLSKESINWDVLTEQAGDDSPQPFSYFTDKGVFPFLLQVSCYITRTNDNVHRILETWPRSKPATTNRTGVRKSSCWSKPGKQVRVTPSGYSAKVSVEKVREG